MSVASQLAAPARPPAPTVPRRRRISIERHPVAAAFVAAAALHLLWWRLFADSGGDLAAQDAWAEFAREHPGSAYNLAWYGGMHPVVVQPIVALPDGRARRAHDPDGLGHARGRPARAARSSAAAPYAGRSCLRSTARSR